MKSRYTNGGDEFIFVEISEEMSLEAFFKVLTITKRLEQSDIQGITEICPANASYQVRYNPDLLSEKKLIGLLRQIEEDIVDIPMKMNTRLVEIPVYYNDPWTQETGSRFRERHQDPNSTDLEYAARINGYESIDAYILAHSGSPWFVSMVGFVAGLPFMYQMVEKERQIQVPKYLTPRTDTPKHTVGHGGCFACIYSVRGAGGYQMFGVTPAPIFNPQQKEPYLKDMMIFFRPGDIVKFQPISKSEYERLIDDVENGDFDLNIRQVSFDLNEYTKNPADYNSRLLGE